MVVVTVCVCSSRRRHTRCALVTGGHTCALPSFSDWCFVLARTNPDAPKHKGISFLLVPMNSEGITVRPLVQLNKDQDFCEVFFDNVKIGRASCRERVCQYV